jgi:CRISPR-associated protein Cas5a/b/c
LTNWYLLKVDLRLAWGFTVKTPTTSAAEMTLLCPPPSTLIGALARGLSHLHEDWSECIINNKTGVVESSAVRLLDFIVSAHFGFSETVAMTPWSDLARSYAVIYQQRQHRPKPEMWFGVHAGGRVYAPGSKVQMIFVINEARAKDGLGTSWKDYLRKAGLCISALGGKEGLIVADNVEVKKGSIVEGGSLKTIYYCPKEALVDYEPEKLYEEEFWDHRKKSSHWRQPVKAKRTPIKRIPYILPINKVDLIPQTIEIFNLSRDGVGLTVDNITEYTVILLKEWLMQNESEN